MYVIILKSFLMPVVQAEVADPELVRQSKLGSCYLSNMPLEQPIVCDYLGNLYNKHAVLEYLLGKLHGDFADEDARHRYVGGLGILILSRQDLGGFEPNF
jgi:hypothetical protein